MKIFKDFTMPVLAFIVCSMTAEGAAKNGGHYSKRLDPVQMIDLKVNSSKITVTVSYPGSTSNICGVRFLISPQVDILRINMSKVISNLTLSSKNTSLPLMFGHSSDRQILEYILPDEVLNNFFEDQIVIETKDGSSLKSLLEKALENQGTIYATTTTCL